jgi:hypothetical protein
MVSLFFVFSVPSVFSVLNAFEFLRDSHAIKSFNTEDTEKNRRRHNSTSAATTSRHTYLFLRALRRKLRRSPASR